MSSSDSAVARIRHVLKAYWSMSLEGQAPSADWLYELVKEAVDSVPDTFAEAECRLATRDTAPGATS